MNLEQLKKDVGFVVQLEPIAYRLDEYGFELPAVNEEWIIQNVANDGVRISNISSGHFALLGPDHIYKFTSNTQHPSAPATQRYGFLSLHVQIVIQGVNVLLRPNGRPGERVPPIPVMVREKVVDIRYPADSGLQAELAALGYRLAWCSESDVTRRIDLDGWAIVVTRDAQGALTRFRLRTRPQDQILLRKLTPEQIALTKEEWTILRGIGSAAALGQVTAKRATASTRLVELGLVGFDAAGHLVLTPPGRYLLDRVVSP